MKLWSHRSTYDNRLNPLFELKPIIQVLQTLDPDKNTWVTHFGDQARNPIRPVYDTFRRLILSLLFRELDAAGRMSARMGSAQSTAQFQEGSEKEIVAAVGMWLTEAQLNSSSKPSKGRSRGARQKIDFSEIARSIVGEARIALDELVESLAPHAIKGSVERRKSDLSKRKPKRELRTQKGGHRGRGGL